MKVKANKPFHAYLVDGLVVDIGSGPFYVLVDGQTALEFDTKKERALHPLVAKWEVLQSIPELDSLVTGMKSEHAYAGKEYDARTLMRHVVDGVLAAGVYEADKFPHLALEIEAKDCTPIEAAEDILMAVERSASDDMGTIAQERARLKLREQVKKIKEGLTTNE